MVPLEDILETGNNLPLRGAKTDKQTNTQTDKQTDRQTDKQTDRQKDFFQKQIFVDSVG